MTRSTRIRIATGLGLLLWLAACGSTPPSSFYRLTAMNAPTPGGQSPALGIGPIEIPQFLNRDALVYSGADNRLHIAGEERWAEPLEDGVQRVVGLNLAQLLHSENLRYYPWNNNEAPDYGVKLRVLDLDAKDQRAILVVDWRLYRPADGTTVSRRISQFEQPLAEAGPTPAELAPAYSALLYQLSEVIATAIRADQADPGNGQDQAAP